jgi:hypothetical protein
MNDGKDWEKTGKYRRTMGKGIKPTEFNTFWWSSLGKRIYPPHQEHRRVSFVLRSQFAGEDPPVNLANHTHI